MSRLAFVLLSGIALSGEAFAADMPLPAVSDQVLVPAAADDWSGFYAGVNVGYGWGDVDSSDVSATEADPLGSLFLPFGTFPGADDSASFDGVIGGGQIGYNLQSGSFVLGIEADVQAGDLEAESTVSVGAPAPTFDNTAEVNLFSTVRGRVGVAFDNFMVFATGGLAVAHVEVGTTVSSGFAPLTPPVSGEDEAFMLGYAVGGGVEYAFSENWSVKAEYIYADLGEEDFTIDVTDTLTTDSTADIEMHIARVGVNYRF